MSSRKRRLVCILIICLFFQSFGVLGTNSKISAATYSYDLQPEMIASGTSHTLFLSNDGKVKVSGSDNGSGWLGLGSTTYTYSTPTIIPNMENVQQVALNNYSSYALLQDGTVKSWGLNSSGQLGLGTSSNKSVPTAIPNLKNVIQIAAGNGFAIALLEDGTLMGWGSNVNGELSSLAATNTPTAIPGIKNVKQLAVGDKFVLALSNNGTIMSWGLNSVGQLGLGDTSNRSVPTTIAELSNVVQVTAGTSYNATYNLDSKKGVS